MVIAAVDDLMFSSKIRSAAKHAEVSITFARSLAALDDALGPGTCRLLIVDLDRSALDPIAIIEHVRRSASTQSFPIVAFGAHVNTEGLRAAREAGADTVLTRSGFVSALPALLLAARGTADL